VTFARLLAPWVVVFGLFPTIASADVFVPRYADPEGFGFRDETPAEPLPGNPAQTLGGQRRAALEAAFGIVASHVDSELPIRIRATFEDFGCPDDGTGVVARGGFFYSSANFAEAPVSNVYYPGSLASHMAGEYRSGSQLEGRIMINARTEEPDCFDSIPDGFWYGIGEAPPAGTRAKPFVPLILHELGHAMGVSTLYDRDTGELGAQWPDVFATHVYVPGNETLWPDLTRTLRRVNARFGNNVAWLGEHASTWAAEVAVPPPVVRVDPQVDGVSEFGALVHGRRPFLPRRGLSGRLVVADNPAEESGIDGVTDEPRDPADACQALSNAADAEGAVVLARRGGCFFRTKVFQAQAAGAVALIVVDSHPASDESAISGNQSILVAKGMTIPLWTMAMADGERLLADPPASVELAYDETEPAVGSIDGLVRLETDYDNLESNIVHVSRRSVPAPFMAGGTGSQHDLHLGPVDMMPGLLADLGWQLAGGKLDQWTGNWFDPARAGEGCQLTLEADGLTWILTCYLYREGEPIWLIGSAVKRAGRIVFDDVSITSGTGYGPEFDPEAVEITHWGTIAIELYDCNTAFFQFLPELTGFRPMYRKLSRIVTGDCNRPASEHPDRSLSGNYFNPQRAGEGIQLAVEANGQAVVMTWYSYHEGRQFWAIGTGYHDAAGDRVVVDELFITRGGDYGPGFDPDEVEIVPFGSATVAFGECGQIQVGIDSALEPFPDIEQPMERLVAGECAGEP
jgi:hypothetical protein